MVSEKCPICDDHIETSYTTTCRHTFCARCIFEWVKTGMFGPRSCPMCRGYIDSEEVRNLFPLEISSVEIQPSVAATRSAYMPELHFFHTEVLNTGTMMQFTGGDIVLSRQTSLPPPRPVTPHARSGGRRGRRGRRRPRGELLYSN